MVFATSLNLRHEGLKSHSTLVWLLLGLLSLTAWRLLLAAQTGPELFFDEAQYWDWARTPDWGYYSKPPMVAWLIALSTHFLGDGELGVRAGALALYPATALLLYFSTRRLAGWSGPVTSTTRHAPWLAALVFATLPVVSMGSWLITTDTPLLFFWSASLYLFIRALDDDRWGDWLALGVALGLGLLSKYTMLFFALAALGYLLATPSRRVRLASAKPYVAALLALALLAPNLIWNAQHDFVSFRHTAEISQLDRALLHPDKLLEFLLAQFAVFGPITLGVLLILSFRLRRLGRDPGMAFLAWFTLPPLLVFLTQALLARAFANWAVIAYVAAAPLVTFWLLSHKRQAWLVAAMALNLAMGAIMYQWHDLARLAGVELNRKTDPYHRIMGWRELGARVRDRLDMHPQARLLADERNSLCELLYYARPQSRPGYFFNPSRRIGNHYALTADIARAPRGEFLLVSKSLDQDLLKSRFSQVTELAPISIPIYRDLVRHYRVFLLRDFQGYAS